MKKTLVLHKGQLKTVLAYNDERLYISGIEHSLTYGEVGYFKDPTPKMLEIFKKKYPFLSKYWD